MGTKRFSLTLGFIFVILLSALSTSVNAETLCSYTGPDLSEDLLRLTDFSVSGQPSLKEGDSVTVKFNLQNYGQYDIKLGARGIFAAARDPDNLDTSFGFTRSNTILKVGETASIEASRILDKADTWKIWPSYHISNKEERFGPNEWHACILSAASAIKDSDKDGIPDDNDNCPQNYNPKQEDSDNDKIGDACDPCDDRDFDKDGIKNCLDKCPNDPETYNQYQDDDGCPDEKPKEAIDTDKDGITDDRDNCPLVYNPDQRDANKNGRGDTCEDSDGDGIIDDKDNCLLAYNPKQKDVDNDGLGDACDPCDDRDSDGDGIKNCLDKCLNEPETYNEYQDEDGCSDEPLVTIEQIPREYRLPCRISGRLYNFTHHPRTVKVKICEAETRLLVTGGTIRQCKLDEEATWYVNVTPRVEIFSVPETVTIMTRVPKEQGISLNLRNWWRDVPPDHEIEIDPLQGQLYLYWLDENGNICHGVPGVSGQPGAKGVVGIIKEELRGREYISADEFSGFQIDSVKIEEPQNTYLAQYAIFLWRVREDGHVFQEYDSGFSLPFEIYLTDYISPAYIQVVDAFGIPLNDCFSRVGLPVPSTGLERGQHPTKCRNKQNISASALIQACLEERLQARFDDYFRIEREPAPRPSPSPTPATLDLEYQTLVSCNNSYLIEPVCQPSKGYVCAWKGTWIATKSNFVTMNGTSQSGYDFTFKPDIENVFVNFVREIWSSIVRFFQSIFQKK